MALEQMMCQVRFKNNFPNKNVAQPREIKNLGLSDTCGQK
jgi:hypothetical protein